MLFALLLVVAFLALLVFVYYKVIKPAKYWEERDVVHVESWPVVGSMWNFVAKKKHLIEVLDDIYKRYPDERSVGYMNLTTPVLLIRDLDLIKQITVKDFDHFHDHTGFDNIKNDPLLSKSVVSLTGENWRRLRATLSPAFTSSKMRFMYTLISDCAHNFTDHFAGKEQIAVEMKDVFSKFANDVIATTAFGVSVDSMKDPDNEFLKMGNKFQTFGFWLMLKIFVMQMAPALANLLKLRIFTEDVSTFFRSLVKSNIENRESGGIVRPDMIHLLMEARKGRLKHEDGKEATTEGFATVEESHVGKDAHGLELTDDHIVAQAVAFFFAGFDTVSTAASFMAYELALHPQIQKKLQDEIDAVNHKHDGKISYETLLSMKYLDQVVCETLRKWPAAFQTDRLCVKNYVIEPIHPKEKVVFVEKGLSVGIPIMAIQRDSRYYDEPERFEPERFSEENRSKIVPGSYMPFGAGPRNCIGSRLALLEIKTLMVHLLSKFIIIPVDETTIPFKFGEKKLNMAPENGFQLGLRPRKF